MKKDNSSLENKTKNEKQEYNFSLDVAQKITFLILMAIVWFSPGFRMIIVMAGSIFGRFFLIPTIESFVDKKSFAKKKREKPFLGISEGIWSLIVLISFIVVMIVSIVQDIIYEQFEIINIFLYLIILVIGFGILTKDTAVTGNPLDSDPNEIGSYAWKKENNVKLVSTKGNTRLYRDKNGNYYTGSAGQYVPTSVPVTIENKDK